jgi:hypothetical protein
MNRRGRVVGDGRRGETDASENLRRQPGYSQPRKAQGASLGGIMWAKFIP